MSINSTGLSVSFYRLRETGQTLDLDKRPADSYNLGVFMNKIRLFPILLCMVIGAVVGGYTAGFPGFIWCGLAGLVAPAALLWIGIIACYCAVILGVFFAAWAAIIFAFFWLVGR